MDVVSLSNGSNFFISGDFAVLLNSGLSMCRALAFNFLSSLLAMVGLYVGLVISTHEETRIWIVAITAGMFLYIALVDLVRFKFTREKTFYLLLS